MLNAKNKKTLTTVGAIFGLAVLVFAIMRAKKQSDATKTPFPQMVQAEVKELFKNV